jgi:2-polyprenyl-3-methyl-5-hydroxy-6-metoxy-1,4-benzoquinol methylase
MSESSYDISWNDEYGYAQLDPIPSDEVLSEYYQSQYPELLEEGEIADDVSRLFEDGDEAERERQWRRTTWYTDYLTVLEEGITDVEKVLDVGCGTGEFVQFMEDNDHTSVGIEPSEQIAEVGKDKGLTIHTSTAEQFANTHAKKFDAVTMFNVLEHVPNIWEVLNSVWELLRPGGMAIIKVPNEFNPFQLAARDLLNAERWWISAPAHISYFDFDSLTAILSEVGFNIYNRLADFPMSLFLLLGDNYIQNDDVGSVCHNNRMEFEQTLDDDTRREFYSTLADGGFGRNCTLFAMKPDN